MKKITGIILTIFGLGLAFLVVRSFWGEEGWQAPEFSFLTAHSPQQVEEVDPLAQYSFPNLKKTAFKPGQVEVGGVIEEDDQAQGRFFWYQAGDKRVSGRVDLPRQPGVYPVVLMIRGYAEKEGYFSGSGTHRAASQFAREGYIALAPDFLGFASSDAESEDILLNRFRRPETVLYLLASLNEVNEGLKKAGLEVQLDPKRVGFWAHSNGGQITLSVLEITGKNYPATLWAPVTQSFPDSILAYASELDDEGRLVIGRINAFSQNHDCAQYSVASYWDWIKSPIQIHQGEADLDVKEADTRTAVFALQAAGVGVDYFVYPGADHNLKQAWDEAIARDLIFFEKWL